MLSSIRKDVSILARGLAWTVVLFAVFAISAAHAETLTGRVVAIADGDTLTLLDLNNRQYRIRLNGIDAPEKRQPYGNRSRKKLSRLVFGRNVPAECSKRDRYGREVCKVLDGSVDAGLEQIRAGYAWWYRAYAKEQSAEDQAAYERAEERAREAKRGLWKDPKPVPPWDFRRERR